MFASIQQDALAPWTSRESAPINTVWKLWVKIRCEIVPGKVEITMCKAHYRYRKRATDKTVMEPVRYHLMNQKICASVNAHIPKSGWRGRSWKPIDRGNSKRSFKSFCGRQKLSNGWHRVGQYAFVAKWERHASSKRLTLPQLKQWDSCFSDRYLHIVNYMPSRAVSTGYVYTVSVCPTVQFVF